MRLARAMKRKMEKQAATGDLRAAKTYLKAKTSVRHATTREIVEQVAIRKQAVAEITTTMAVAVHRIFGWGADRILRLRKKMRSQAECIRWKQVNLLEAEACPDHIHILVEIPPKISVSNFMGFLKGKSSLMIYEKWGNMKYKYRNRSFWCRGDYVSTVGKNEKKITEYIQNQLKEDYMSEQLVLDMTDPFTGSRK